MADEWIVEELNQFLRGWGGYFRYGNSARTFDAISQYSLERLAGFVAKRHKRNRIWGMRLVTCGSPDNFRLITLCGTVDRAASLLPGSLATTRTGLRLAGDGELLIRS